MLELLVPVYVFGGLMMLLAQTLIKMFTHIHIVAHELYVLLWVCFVCVRKTNLPLNVINLCSIYFVFFIGELDQ